MKRVYLIAFSIIMILTGCGTSEAATVLENRVIKGIVVTKEADKLEYKEGEKLDITGLEVSILYTDSSTKRINITTANITGFDTPALGEKEITITANGYSTTYWIKINGENYGYGKFNVAGKTGEINDMGKREEADSVISYMEAAPWTVITIQNVDEEDKMYIYLEGIVEKPGTYKIYSVIATDYIGNKSLGISNSEAGGSGSAVITKIDSDKGIIEGSFITTVLYGDMTYDDMGEVVKYDVENKVSATGEFKVHQGRKIGNN